MTEENTEIARQVRQILGLVHLKGLLTWPQQQLLSKLSDPLATQILEIAKTMDPAKKEWKKILKKLVKEEKA